MKIRCKLEIEHTLLGDGGDNVEEEDVCRHGGLSDPVIMLSLFVSDEFHDKWT